MYSIVTLFLSITTYFYFKKSYALFNIFTFLSFLTFYGSVFYIFTIFTLTIIQKKPKLLPKLIPGFLLSLLLISPLLYRQLFLSKTLLKNVTNWSLVLGRANLKNLLLIPIKFTFGRITFYPKSIYYVVASLWTIFIFFNLTKIKQTKSLLFLFIFPLILVFLISFHLPMLQFFRYLYLLPIFSLILSISATKSKLFILLGFFVLSSAYLFSSSQHREDWKSLANALPENSDIYLISSFADPLKYYRPDLNIIDIRQLGKTDQVHKPPIFVIPYGLQIFGYDHQPGLESYDFTLSQTQNFRQISLETWSYNPI